MSSAILYLAIVAIWAMVLVPRWLHRRPAQPEPAEQPWQPQAAPTVTAEPMSQDADADPVPELAGEPGDAEAAYPLPDDGRAPILQARRRMLIALAVLTVGAAGLAVTGVTAPWVIVPPALLLAGFVVLLREAGRADAERVRRATGIDYAEAPPMADEEPESFSEDAEQSRYQATATAAAPGAAQAQPDAEVIDISARISDQVYDQYSDDQDSEDQVYDQYSDAAERAVGD